MSETKKNTYWKLPKEELLREYETTAVGLDETEAECRLSKLGPNEIPSIGHRTSLRILASQFKNPLVYVLIIASTIAGFLGDTTEAIIIVAIVLANAILGFILEHRSERAVDELRKYLSYTTVVIRQGKKQVITSSKLVSGDLVYLSTGDMVPADIRLIDSDELQTDESVLTGESATVEKNPAPIAQEKLLPHQLSNTALMGSKIMSGFGTGIVVATGNKTYFGRVASSLSLLPPKTDFQKNMASFGSFIIRLILLLTAFVFLVNAILNHGILESLLFALALAVGIIPEALPVVITVGLSEGALRLVKKKVIVKRLESIEDLGNVDVLCTDKTGTLTQNKVTLDDILDPEGHPAPELIKYALLCNSAVVEGDKVLGNPIDVAIWEYAREKKFSEESLASFACVREVPFGFNRRRMSSVIEHDSQRFLVSKGAPESILEVSNTISDEDKSQSIATLGKAIEQLILKYTQTGHRLIAIAVKNIEAKTDYSTADEHDLTLAGFLVLSDPLKEDAAPAIAKLKSLGIRLKVLSGDDPVVTAEVCHKVGIDIKDKVLTGADIENMQEETLYQAVENNDVFGRVTPEQKYAIVGALKKNGHVVGFLGDGVNDAPALKLADAGISVDSGVQVAKEASSVILLEKSLDTVSEGVAEGRKAFGNMIKYIRNTISANLGNMITLAIGSLFLPFIPLLPSQILLANLVSDAPLLTIATDNLDSEDLQTPKKWSIKSIARFALFFGVVSSIFDFVTISSLIYLLNADPEIFRTAWFIESVMSEILVTFSIRTKKKFYKSRPSRLLLTASIIVAASTMLIVASPLGLLFDFVMPPPWFLGLIAAILIGYFLLVEGVKHLFFSRYDI